MKNQKGIRMSGISEHIINNYMVRRTWKQKSAFIRLIRHHCKVTGWSCAIERDGISRNIIIGDLDQAELIFSAHYDTPVNTVLPYLLVPAHHKLVSGLIAGFGILAFVILFILSSVVLNPAGNTAVGLITITVLLLSAAAYYFFGIPNRCNWNDNTSGILTILSAMECLDPAEIKHPAFVFFDNEEKLFLGSRAFRKRHGSSKILINFDCVADGENILLSCRRSLRDTALYHRISNCFLKNTADFGICFSAEDSEKATISSDHIFFDSGIGVAAFNKSSRSELLYFTRIHSLWDTRFRRKNIEYLAKCICDLYH